MSLAEKRLGDLDEEEGRQLVEFLLGMASGRIPLDAVIVAQKRSVGLGFPRITTPARCSGGIPDEAGAA